jgi:hypothetical protein
MVSLLGFGFKTQMFGFGFKTQMFGFGFKTQPSVRPKEPQRPKEHKKNGQSGLRTGPGIPQEPKSLGIDD